jgi:hypothetical protein
MQHQLVEVKAIQIECNCADTQSRKPDPKNFTEIVSAWKPLNFIYGGKR